MEEKIELIKQNLTGDVEKDIEFLNSLYNQEAQIIEEASATIDAINIIAEAIQNEISNEETEEESEEVEETKTEEENEKELKEKEINDLLIQVNQLIEEGNDEEALSKIEGAIDKIEEMDNKSDENTIYCSFGSEFERELFERIFAGEKEVKTTTYANDTLYVIYAKMLIAQNKRIKAMTAIDRAIYWNFLNREARTLKLEMYLDKNSVVKYLETVRKLQKISYTPEHLADCYNRYAYIFNELNDTKSAYAMYRISYSYFQNELVENVIRAYEESNPELKEMTIEEIIYLAEENDVEFGPNVNIIKAHRDITKEYIEQGEINIARELLRDDYIMTGNEEIAELYNQISDLELDGDEESEDVYEDEVQEEVIEETQEPEELPDEISEEITEEVEEKPKKRATRKKSEEKNEEEEKPKKKASTTKKTTTKKTTKKEVEE